MKLVHWPLRGGLSCVTAKHGEILNFVQVSSVRCARKLFSLRMLSVILLYVSQNLRSSTTVCIQIEYNSFLPRSVMHKRSLCRHAVSVCVVCLSVTLVDCVTTNKHMLHILKFFYRCVRRVAKLF